MATRGTDYVQTIRVIDESRPDPADAFVIVLFRRQRSDFPEVRSVGDIIRVHRMFITSWDDSPQGKVAAGFACVVLGGKPSDSMEPYSNTAQKYSTIDAARVKALREFGQRVVSTEPLIPLRKLFSLSNFPCPATNNQMNFDAICKVVEQNQSGAVIWDGTGRNTTVAQKDSTFQADSQNVLLLDQQGR